MPAEPPNPAAPAARPRPCLATWVFVGFMAAFLLLFNLPGQEVLEPSINGRGKGGPSFSCVRLHHHGWPLTTVRRGYFRTNVPDRPSVWDVTDDVESVDPVAIIVNSGVAIGVLVVGGILFQWQLTRRGSWRQFRLAELLGLVLLIAIGAQRFAAARAAGRAERSAVKEIQRSAGASRPYVVWQPAGPTWLRRLLGDSLFADLDHVVELDPYYGSNVRLALPLQRLQVLRIQGSVSTAELELLEGLPDLIGLNLQFVYGEYAGTEGEDNLSFKIPRLANLRGLNLYGTTFRGDGLENVPSLEVLDLTNTDVTDESIEKIVRMRILRFLALGETAVTPAGVALLADLPHLEELTLGGVASGQKESLITDAIVPSLSRFRHLRHLTLFGTTITPEGFAALRAVLPNCEIQE